MSSDIEALRSLYIDEASRLSLEPTIFKPELASASTATDLRPRLQPRLAEAPTKNQLPFKNPDTERLLYLEQLLNTPANDLFPPSQGISAPEILPPQTTPTSSPELAPTPQVNTQQPTEVAAMPPSPVTVDTAPQTAPLRSRLKPRQTLETTPTALQPMIPDYRPFTSTYSPEADIQVTDRENSSDWWKPYERKSIWGNTTIYAGPNADMNTINAQITELEPTTDEGKKITTQADDSPVYITPDYKKGDIHIDADYWPSQRPISQEPARIEYSDDSNYTVCIVPGRWFCNNDLVRMQGPIMGTAGTLFNIIEKQLDEVDDNIFNPLNWPLYMAGGALLSFVHLACIGEAITGTRNEDSDGRAAKWEEQQRAGTSTTKFGFTRVSDLPKDLCRTAHALLPQEKWLLTANS